MRTRLPVYTITVCSETLAREVTSQRFNNGILVWTTPGRKKRKLYAFTDARWGADEDETPRFQYGPKKRRFTPIETVYDCRRRFRVILLKRTKLVLPKTQYARACEVKRLRTTAGAHIVFNRHEQRWYSETERAHMYKHFATGGVKPLRASGRLVLKVQDAGENDFISRFLCSCYGWTFGDQFVAQGATVEKAVREWCKGTGNDYDEVLAECRFRNGDPMPPGGQAAEW